MGDIWITVGAVEKFPHLTLELVVNLKVESLKHKIVLFPHAIGGYKFLYPSSSLGGSLPCSKQSAASLDPKPDVTSHTPSHSLRSNSKIFSRLYLGLPMGLFPSHFPTRTLYALLYCPLHAVYPTYLNLLDLVYSDDCRV